jgi:hypothetical protein
LLQREFASLKERAKAIKIHQNDSKTLEESTLSIYITSNPNMKKLPGLYTGGKVMPMPLGFAVTSNLSIDDCYTNPFDKTTHFRCVDINYQDGQALFLVVDNNEV